MSGLGLDYLKLGPHAGWRHVATEFILADGGRGDAEHVGKFLLPHTQPIAQLPDTAAHQAAFQRRIAEIPGPQDHSDQPESRS